jgi:hypothetical protein
MLSKNFIQIQFFGEKENVFHILVPLMMFCKLSLSHHSLLQCGKAEKVRESESKDEKVCQNLRKYFKT